MISVLRGIALALAIVLSPLAFAQQGPANLNVSGGLFLPSGLPVTSSSVNFRLQIWDKAGTCLLYTEDHLAQDLSASKGGFSLAVGLGANANNLMESTTALSSKIFENNGVIAGGWANCPSGANLAPGDDRLIRVFYDLGGGFVAMSPDVPIASAAYAMVAETLQGKRPSDLIQVKDDVTTDLTQANVENVFSSTNYARLQQLLNPSAAIGFGSQRLTNLANPSAAQDAATKNYTDTNLAGQTIDLVDVAPGFGGGKVLTWDSAGGKWVAQAPAIAGTAGGDLTGSYPNPTIAALAVGTTKLANDAVTSAKINSTGIATNRLLVTDATTGATVTYANCSNNEILKYVTGTGWQCATVASLSAVTSVAGKSGAVTLNAADINGLGTAAVRDIGTAATEVPELDAGGKLAVSTIPLFAGDVTGAIGANIVTQLQGRELAATAPNLNEVLRWNGSRWEPQALTDNVGITALNGDVTASGTGLVAATINNGAVTTPKMFATPGANRLVATDATTGATLTAFTCNLNETMQWTAAGWACVDVSSLVGTGYVVNNGNTLGAPLTVGTNDGQPLRFETNNVPKMSILSTGEVGIGTTSPNRLLEVAGPVRIAPAALPVTPGAGDMAIDSGAGNALKYYNGSSWISLAVGGTGDFKADGTVPMTGAFRSIAGNAGAPGMTFVGDTANGVFAPAANTFAVTTSGAEKLRVTSAGNVGIGTTTPNTKLEVDGNIRLTNGGELQAANNSNLTLKTVNNIGNVILDSADTVQVNLRDDADGLRDFRIDSVGVGTPFFVNGETAMVGIGTSAPNRLLEVAGPVRIAPAALPGTPGAGDMAIDSGAGNALKYYNGSNWISLAVGGTGDFKADGTVAMTGAFRSIAGNAGAPGMTFVGDTANGVFAPAANTFAVSTAGTERLRVTSAGTVGIGTSTPDYQFQVRKDQNVETSIGIRNETDSGSSGVALYLKNNGGNPAYLGLPSSSSSAGPIFQNRLTLGSSNSHLGINLMAEAASGDIRMYTGGYTAGEERLRITGSGSVGIGTTSPNRLLEVAGPVRIAPAALPGTPGAGDIAIDSGAANALKYYNGSNWVDAAGRPSQWNTTGNDIYYDTGRVAVGTSSPPAWLGTKALYVNDEIYAEGSIRSSSNMAATNFGTDDGSAGLVPSGSGATGTLAFKTNGSEKIRITTSGDVGIGTTTPAAKLHVAGNAYLNGTNGIVDTSVTAEPTYVDTGVLLKATAATPYITAKLGTATAGSAFIVRDSAENDRFWVRGDGNVGIGTSAPNRLLEVAGPVRIAPTALPGTPGAGDIAVDSGSGNTLKWYNGSAWQTVGTSSATGDINNGGNAFGGAATVGTNDNFDLNLETNNLPRLTVSSTGSVGIGTTNPTQALDVTGSVNASTSVISPLVTSGTGVAMTLQPGPASGTTASTGNSLLIRSGPAGTTSGNGGTLSMGSSPGTGTVYNGGTVNLFTAGGGSSGNGGAMNITTGSATGTGYGGALSITSGNGNGGAGGSGGAISITGGTALGTGTGGAVTISGGIGGTAAVAGGAVTVKGGEGSDNGPGGTATLSGGNGGSTSGAGGPVDISGGIPVSGAGGSVNITATAGVGSNQNGGNVVIASGAATGSGAAGSIQLLSNVGIGTTSPARLLNVAGPMRLNPDVLPGAPGAGDIAVDSGAGNVLKWYNGSAWQTVGTSSATGDINNGGNTFGAAATIGTNDGFALNFETNNAARMTIDNAGKVGIGTTNPGAALEVAGTVKATAVDTSSIVSNGIEALHVNTTASGVNYVTVTPAIAGNGPILSTAGADATVPLNLYSKGGGAILLAPGQAPAFKANFVATSVNYLQVQGATAGNSPVLSAAGTDANVDIMLTPKGSGDTLITTGNVGIGTTAPASQLDIRSTSTDVVSWLRSSNAPSTSALVIGNNTNANQAVLEVFGSGWGDSALQNKAMLSAKSTSAGLNIATLGNLPISFLTNSNGSSNERMRIDGSGNVGIGASPARLLHVGGPIRVQPAGLPGVPGAGDIAIDSGAGNVLKWYNGSAWQTVGTSSATGDINNGGNTFGAAATIGTNDGFALNLETNNTKRLTVTSTGEVGIGTTSPSGVFQVNRDQNADTTARVANYDAGGGATATFGADSDAAWTHVKSFSAANGGASQLYGTGTSLTLTANAGTAPIKFETGGANERMRITNTGNVGIGMTSPARLLNVAGPMRLDPAALPGTPGAGDIAIDSGAGNALKFYNGSAWQTVGTSSATGDINNGGNSFSGIVNIGTNDNFALNLETNNQPRLTVLGGGSVGIGTTSPGQALDVNGIAKATRFRADNGNAAAPAFAFTSGTNSGFYYDGSWQITAAITGTDRFAITGSNVESYVPVYVGNGAVNTPEYTFMGDVDTGMYHAAANQIGFSTSGAERVRIDSNGNVGIGTTSPAGFLTGSGLAVGSTAPRNGIAIFGNQAGSDGPFGDLSFWNNGGRVSLIQGQRSGADNSGNLTFWTQNAGSIAEQMRITNTGNVGIGTSAPARLLNVAGPIRLNPAALPGAPGAGDIAIDSGAGNALKFYNGSAWQTVGTSSATGDINNGGNSFSGIVNIGTNDNFALNLETNNQPRLTATGGGNVGVGTTAPSAKFSVGGSAADKAYFFYDNANLAAGTDGQSVYIYRREAGNDSALRFYIDQYREGYITDPLGTMTHLHIGTEQTNAILDLQDQANGDITMFDKAISGETRSLNVSGFRAGDALRTMSVAVGANAANTASFTGVAKYHFDGNVGVGTSTPGYLVDLRNSNGSGQLHLSGSGNDDGIYLIANSSTGGGMAGNTNFNGTNWVAKAPLASLMTTASGVVRFYTDSGLTAGNTYVPSERVRIDTNGNVGIGITTPARLLHVNGPMRLEPAALPGTPAAGDIAIDSNAANALKYHNGTNWVSIGSGAGDFLASGTVPMTGNLRLNGHWLSGDGGNEGLSVDSTGRVGIGTTSLLAGSMVDIEDAAGKNFVIDANAAGMWLGVGVNPVTTLHVVSSESAVGGALFDNTSNAAAPTFASMSASRQTSTVGNGVGAAFLMRQADASRKEYGYFGSIIESNTNGSQSGSLVFMPTKNSARTEAMRITSAGNVGIGTTTPARLLQVAGPIRISPTTNPGSPAAGDLFIDSAASNALKYYDGSAWVSAGGGGAATPAGANRQIQFNNSGVMGASSNLNFVNSGDGQLIVGSAGLTIGDAILLRRAVDTEVNLRLTNATTGFGGSNSGFEVELLQKNAGLTNHENGFLAVSTNDLERMRIAATGEVGIGTTNPVAPLHVSSPATTDNSPIVNFAPSLATGNSVYYLVGRSPNSNDSGFIGYTHNTTQANRSLGLGHYGAAPAITILNGGNVGIGTGAPSRTLQVNGAMKITPTTNPASPTAGDIFVDSAASNALKYYNGSAWVSAGGGGMTGSLAPGEIAFGDGSGNIDGSGSLQWNDGTQELALWGSITMNSTGGPWFIFHRDDTTVAAGDNLAQFMAGSEDSNQDAEFMLVKASAAHSGTANGNYLQFLTTPDTSVTPAVRMQISSNGNVGIGTTAPAYPLTVAGNQNSALGMAVNNTSTGNAAESNLFIGKDFTTTWQAGALTYRGSGFTPAGNINPNQFEIISWSGATNGMLVGPEGNAPLKFMTNNTERVRVLANGNVGIGTSTPNTSLEVSSKTADGNILISSTATNANATLDLWSRVGGVTKYSSILADWSGNLVNRAETGLYTWRNGADSANTMSLSDTGLSIGSGAATARVLNTNGAIRIAPTAAPGTPAAGDIFVDSTSSNTLKYYDGSAWVSAGGGAGGLPAANGTVGTPSINFTNSTGMGFYRIGANVLGVATAGVNRMSINASGNIGIGMTNQSEKLDVNGNVRATQMVVGTAGAFISDAGGAGNLTLNPGAGVIETGWGSAFQVNDSSGNPKIKLIGSGASYFLNGNVGIGTSTPGSPLEVIGPIRGGGLILNGTGYTVATGIVAPAANTLALNTGGSERLRIDSSGFIGIGMSNPSVALDVAGDIEYTGTITDVSDRRLKENIVPLDSSLAMIRELPVYSYTMKGDKKQKTEYGVMAQDLRALVPNLTSVIDPEHGYIGVNYIGLIPWSIRAIQEVDREVASVKAENADLKSRVEKLEEQNRVLSEQVQKLIELHQQSGK